MQHELFIRFDMKQNRYNYTLNIIITNIIPLNDV